MAHRKIWTRDEATADKVAHAVLLWAKDKGATMVTHLFQPLGSTGERLVALEALLKEQVRGEVQPPDNSVMPRCVIPRRR